MNSNNQQSNKKRITNSGSSANGGEKWNSLLQHKLSLHHQHPESSSRALILANLVSQRSNENPLTNPNWVLSLSRNRRGDKVQHYDDYESNNSSSSNQYGHSPSSSYSRNNQIKNESHHSHSKSVQSDREHSNFFMRHGNVLNSNSNDNSCKNYISYGNDRQRDAKREKHRKIEERPRQQLQQQKQLPNKTLFSESQKNIVHENNTNNINNGSSSSASLRSNINLNTKQKNECTTLPPPPAVDAVKRPLFSPIFTSTPSTLTQTQSPANSPCTLRLNAVTSVCIPATATANTATMKIPPPDDEFDDEIVETVEYKIKKVKEEHIIVADGLMNAQAWPSSTTRMLGSGNLNGGIPPPSTDTALKYSNACATTINSGSVVPPKIQFKVNPFYNASNFSNNNLNEVSTNATQSEVITNAWNDSNNSLPKISRSPSPLHSPSAPYSPEIIDRAGFINIGNSCYNSSLLSTLLRNPLFTLVLIRVWNSVLRQCNVIMSSATPNQIEFSAPFAKDEALERPSLVDQSETLSADSVSASRRSCSRSSVDSYKNFSGDDEAEATQEESLACPTAHILTQPNKPIITKRKKKLSSDTLNKKQLKDVCKIMPLHKDLVFLCKRVWRIHVVDEACNAANAAEERRAREAYERVMHSINQYEKTSDSSSTSLKRQREEIRKEIKHCLSQYYPPLYLKREDAVKGNTQLPEVLYSLEEACDSPSHEELVRQRFNALIVQRNKNNTKMHASDLAKQHDGVTPKRLALPQSPVALYGFFDGMQHDVHEYLISLLAILEEEVVEVERWRRHKIGYDNLPKEECTLLNLSDQRFIDATWVNKIFRSYLWHTNECRNPNAGRWDGPDTPERLCKHRVDGTDSYVCITIALPNSKNKNNHNDTVNNYQNNNGDDDSDDTTANEQDVVFATDKSSQKKPRLIDRMPKVTSVKYMLNGNNPQEHLPLQSLLERAVRNPTRVDDYKCDVCGDKLHQVVYGAFITPMPLILLLQLQRFRTHHRTVRVPKQQRSLMHYHNYKATQIPVEYEEQVEFTVQKIEQRVEVPQILIIRASDGALAKAQGRPGARRFVHFYHINAIVNHHGSTPDSGHYTAVVQNFAAERKIEDGDESVYTVATLQEAYHRLQRHEVLVTSSDKANVFTFNGNGYRKVDDSHVSNVMAPALPPIEVVERMVREEKTSADEPIACGNVWAWIELSGYVLAYNLVAVLDDMNR